MKIEDWPIDNVHPYDRNPRHNDGRAVDVVAESLRQYGFRQPIVVDTSGVIIVGHTRWKAAKQLGMATVPVHIADLSAEQARAYRIADNKTGEAAEWDDDLLRGELEALGAIDVDLQSLGFTSDELDALLKPAGPTEVVEDEVPEPPAEPVTKPGDLWILGQHRLLCGDSTKADDVARLMGGKRASCVFTDPPYGVSIGAKNRMLNSTDDAGRRSDDIKDDALSPEELEAALLPAFQNLRTSIMAEDCTLFVSAPQGGELGMMMMMQKSGLKVRHVLIWKKNQPTFSLGRLDYDYQHEPILLTWGKRHKRPLKGPHRTSVWEIDRERKCSDHPTMKPVAIYANAYLNNSDDGDAVADIYSGSGTMFIAAEQLNRRAFGMEISPAYCDVIVKRWENLTGQKAVLST